MKWLKDNPLGMALVASCGVLALIALVMAIIWTLPEDEVIAGSSTREASSGGTAVAARQAAAMNEFLVINERPVFNESRLPEVKPELDADDVVEDTVVKVKEAPDVSLTGVIITPSMKIASLTPADKNLEGVMVHEGQVLEGEFVGWHISSVNPRNVVLESRDGQKLDLELQVHDTAIKQPPKPVAPAKKAPVASAQKDAFVDEDGEPLSRAEQIRMRIAERREELRREQEIQQAKQGLSAQSQALGNKTNQAAKPQDYQSAIRAMMNKNKDQRSNDNEDG